MSESQSTNDDPALNTGAAQNEHELLASLERSQADLKLALSAGRMGTWDWDIAAGRVHWSAEEEALYGIPAGSFEGTPEAYLELVHPDDREEGWRLVEEAIARKAELHHVLHRVLLPDGSIRWLDSHGRFVYDAEGRPLRLVGVSTDVTDRVLYQRMRDRQSDMLGAVNVGVWYCDLPFNELQWDRKVKEHFWLPADARVTIELFYERIHHEDRERTRTAIDHSIAHHTPYDVEYRTVAPEGTPAAGSVRWVRAIGYTGYDRSGNPIRFDGVTVDITQQKLDRLAAEEANRAKSEFLARMSHDLRTPLNAIGGYTQLIEMGIHGSVTDGQRDALKRIMRAQDHLLTIINDILSFARLEAGQVRIECAQVPVHEVTEELKSLIRTEAEKKGLRLEVRSVDPHLEVYADRQRLMQVLLNLTSNALKFTREGSIWIEAEGDEQHVRIHVADTGMGIPAERLTSIFDPFVQGGSAADEQRRGVGLGLAIGRELTRMMRGDLTVESTENAGSRFTITLPRSA